MKKLIPQSIKNIYHLCRSVFSAVWFGFPAKKLKVIGVTGTNGKTTTVQMIAKILEEVGHKVAVSSTINFQIGEEKWVNKTKFTTLSGWQTQKFIAQAAKANCEYLVLEVGSHALDQHRLWGVYFDVAVVTNVTREHLDYHKTMEKYRRAKMKLFGMLKKKGTAVVNLDMEDPQEFLEVAGDAQKYGYLISQKSKLKTQNHNSKLKTIKAERVELYENGSLYEIDGIKFKLNLAGQFNVENALAAICVGFSQGIELEKMAEALKNITGVPGRMEHVPNDRGTDVVIDYAVTPDSMEKLGQMFKNRSYFARPRRATKDEQSTIDNHKLIWVFGSCGERDRGKRPIMGEIVAKYADIAIVTNEDPYNENPQRIIDEVFAGVLKGGKTENKNAFRIFDRRGAIKKALETAQEGDTVLITGKGAEETMAIGKERIDWNDKRVVTELLESL